MVEELSLQIPNVEAPLQLKFLVYIELDLQNESPRPPHNAAPKGSIMLNDLILDSVKLMMQLPHFKSMQGSCNGSGRVTAKLRWTSLVQLRPSRIHGIHETTHVACL